VSFDQDGFNREVGLRLQLTRKQHDLTQAEVAESLGIPRATYANLEGGRQRIAVDILWRAAVLFDIPIEKLLPEPIKTPRSPAEAADIRQVALGPTGPTGYVLTAGPSDQSRGDERGRS
jgi:transcriptional regulator with XRE-family HTH domain